MPWTTPFVSKGEKIKRDESPKKQGSINIKNVGKQQAGGGKARGLYGLRFVLVTIY